MSHATTIGRLDDATLGQAARALARFLGLA
jgi:hypothetical protein